MGGIIGKLLPACLALALAQGSLQACATVQSVLFPEVGTIREEKAVIIWDEARHIEHFIRQAQIDTTAPDLGFLVPTPSLPVLVEANPTIFQLVDEVAAPTKIPRVEVTSLWEIVGSPLMPLSLVTLGTEVTPVFDTITYELGVKVLGEQDVGGYHASLLAADNSAALAQWLKSNGYGWNPDDEVWLKPYLEAHWTITAFKLIKPAVASPVSTTNWKGTLAIDTTAIRMSFATDRPFFPYSEPSRARTGPHASEWRRLSVAILARQRMKGALADGTRWPGELRFAGESSPTPEITRRWLDLAKLTGPDEAATIPSYLTCFRDNSSPRPGTADLYFSPDANQASFRRIEVDQSLPPRHEVRWGNPLDGFLALSVALLIPGCFIHAGRRLYLQGRAGATANATEDGKYYSTRYIMLMTGMLFLFMIFGLIACALLSTAQASAKATQSQAAAQYARRIGLTMIAVGVGFLAVLAASFLRAFVG